MNIKVETWPPLKKGRIKMITGKMPIGVKAIDTDTGKSVCINIYREMHRNKAEAIRQLKED